MKIGPAIATLFRQALQLPFINGGDSRMIPNTFEAYQLEAELWKDFRLNIGYVAGMKPRTSADFEPMSNIAGVLQVNRGTSFGGFLIGSEHNTFLGAIEELTWDLFSCSYVQAGRTWKFQHDFEIRGDVQFVFDGTQSIICCFSLFKSNFLPSRFLRGSRGWKFRGLFGS